MSNVRTWHQALFVGGAIALPVLLYLAGYSTMGAAFMLSTVLVFVAALVRAGALSSHWLQRETPRTIGNAARYELAWAFLCAGLAVDTLFGGVALAMRHRPYPRHDVTLIVILTVALLFVIGAGLFLTRWFAGYLLSKR
jgi:hypothetical protein